MLPEFLALLVLLAMAVAGWRHALRISRVRFLAFGPSGQPRAWTRCAPFLSALAMAAATWGLASLLWIVEPRVHNQEIVDDNQIQHLIMVVDVSPSMGLEDSGPDMKQTRRQRAADVVASIFDRIPMSQFRITFMAVYSDAKLLLEDSSDYEVVRHMLADMPMWHAFKRGKTDLFAGLELAAKTARPWNPGSTTVLVLTDGDTVPAKGMPQMPAAVKTVLIVGVGDPTSGRFIDGHLSRQDVSTLRQVANRLRGNYHNGNDKQVPSKLVSMITESASNASPQTWTRREWSLAALLLGSAILALLPPLLHYFGTPYQPGHRQ